MHSNVGTVVRFEVGRTLKNSFFWVGAFLGPVLMVLFIMATGAAGATVGGSASGSITDQLNVVYLDDSDLISPATASLYEAKTVASAEEGVRLVQTGEAGVFLHFPTDPASQVTEVAGVDIGLSGYLSYNRLAQGMMQSAAGEQVGDAMIVGLLDGQMASQVTMWDGDKQADGLGTMIPLFLFVAVFYLVFFLQGNRMVIAPLEEKQNRVTEMILTTITADALLVGKIISVLVIGLTQMAVIGVLGVVGMLVLSGSGGFSLPPLVFAPVATLMSTVILLSGFLLFAGLLVTVGAAVPTEKDAQGLFSGILMVLILPLILMIVLVLTNPTSVVIDVLTYFPLTAAPIALVRNAMGTLSVGQGIAVVLITLVSAFITLRVAARLFQSGSVEYTKTIPLKAALVRA